MRNEGIRTLLTAAILCFVCSIVVSSVAIKMRPMQKKNQEIDTKKTILLAANVIEKTATADEVETAFNKVQTFLIDMRTGSRVEVEDPETFDTSSAEKIRIPAKKDIASLLTISSIEKAYVLKNGDEVEAIIVPIISKGLFSTMYGFVALEGDVNTIRGLSYYQHGETAGLGGEVDNPKWKASWVGKKIYDEDMTPRIDVVKRVSDSTHQVDALSGATITSDGVASSLKFWFGPDAYKPFLEKVKAGEF